MFYTLLDDHRFGQELARELGSDLRYEIVVFHVLSIFHDTDDTCLMREILATSKKKAMECDAAYIGLISPFLFNTLSGLLPFLLVLHFV